MLSASDIYYISIYLIVEAAGNENISPMVEESAIIREYIAKEKQPITQSTKLPLDKYNEILPSNNNGTYKYFYFHIVLMLKNKTNTFLL